MARYGEWDGTLFSCFDDCETCIYVYYCAPCVFGQNAHKIDGSNCCFMCTLHWCLTYCWLCWIPQCMKRRILRKKYGLKADPNCPDCPASCFCYACALCQETRFLKRMEAKHSGAVVAVVVPDPVSATSEPR